MYYTRKEIEEIWGTFLLQKKRNWENLGDFCITKENINWESFWGLGHFLEIFRSDDHLITLIVLVAVLEVLPCSIPLQVVHLL